MDEESRFSSLGHELHDVAVGMSAVCFMFIKILEPTWQNLKPFFGIWYLHWSEMAGVENTRRCELNLLKQAWQTCI